MLLIKKNVEVKILYNSGEDKSIGFYDIHDISTLISLLEEHSLNDNGNIREVESVENWINEDGNFVVYVLVSDAK